MKCKERKSVTGPEAELVSAFIEHGLPGYMSPSVVFREPELPTGFPDIVAVYPTHKSEFPQSRLSLTYPHIRAAHHLCRIRGDTLENLASSLGLSRKRMNSLVADLINANIARKCGKQIVARALSKVFVARRIVTVEAKMHNWRRAIEQAAANTWFASHSYILVPPHMRFEMLGEADEFGVGVLIWDGNTIQVMAKPRKQRLPASYGSWIINEWTIRRLQTETVL